MTHKECSDLFHEARLAKIAQALVAFTLRASEKGATPEEVRALPEVARLIFDYSVSSVGFEFPDLSSFEIKPK